MVRLENKHGVAVYVTPGEVRTISPHKDEGVTVIHTGDSFFNVRGTPDEVHAKLFPDEALRTMSALSVLRSADEATAHMQRVLTECLTLVNDAHQSETRTSVNLHGLAAALCKALGREAP